MISLKNVNETYDVTAENNNNFDEEDDETTTAATRNTIDINKVHLKLSESDDDCSSTKSSLKQVETSKVSMETSKVSTNRRNLVKTKENQKVNNCR